MRWHALHIFIDAFQGCYKDGTNGTRDSRYFSTAFLIARVLPIIIFAVSPVALFYGAAQFVLITLAMLIAIVQPYKPQFSVYNAVDSVLILLMAVWWVIDVCVNIAGLKAHRWQKFFVLLSFIVAVLPLLYISFVTVRSMCCRRNFSQRIIRMILGWHRGNTGRVITADSEESLPDRVINPADYPQIM